MSYWLFWFYIFKINKTQFEGILFLLILVCNGLCLQSPAASSIRSERGVIYIGHIPHGFYEKEMKGYFSQFGTVTHVRLARSRKVSLPRHAALPEESILIIIYWV